MAIERSKMALSVGHTTIETSTMRLCLGKSFQQPLALPDFDNRYFDRNTLLKV